MSTRTLRKLREDRELAKQGERLDHVDELDDDEASVEDTKQKVSAFVMMEDSSDDEDADDGIENEARGLYNRGADEYAGVKTDSGATADIVNDDDHLEQQDEDIDAILADFQDEKHLKIDDGETEARYFSDVVNGLDARDLDFESALKNNSLVNLADEQSNNVRDGGRQTRFFGQPRDRRTVRRPHHVGAGNGMASYDQHPRPMRRSNAYLRSPTAEQTSNVRRGGRQSHLFGKPRDGWTTRPPYFIGGGIGMTTYDQNPKPLPWPYAAPQTEGLDGIQQGKCWFTFIHSTTYKRDLDKYYEVQKSGDVNALALFVTDNPFVPEALLQLAKAAYQRNQNTEALALLQRSLWIYECSALKSFTPHAFSSCFVDCDLKENMTYFRALFLLIQVSSIAGCMPTSMALARYVLAMDPLRDPMSVLVLLDFFALSTKTTAHDMFVINLVEKAEIKLHYRDEESKEYVGKLTDMPNWAFSYALALYRVEQQSLVDDGIETDSMASKDALVAAIRRYPSIVEEILRRNEVSTTVTSTSLCWPTVLQSLNTMALPPSHQLGYDPIIYYATKSASDTIASIFVERSFKLWGSHDVQKWLYTAAIEAISADPNNADRQLSPALQRYARIDKANFEGRFRLLPAEGNSLDPGLLAISLGVDTNRRRSLRAGDRGGHQNIDPLEAVENRARAGMQGISIGGPPTHDIDPDSPILEVLWKSMLPWNRVQGVPPARR